MPCSRILSGQKSPGSAATTPARCSGGITTFEGERNPSGRTQKHDRRKQTQGEVPQFGGADGAICQTGGQPRTCRDGCQSNGVVLRRDPAGPPQGAEDVAGGAGREGRCEAKLHRSHREGRGGYAALLADPHRRSIETEFTTAITYWLGYDKTGDSKGDRPEDGRRGRTYVQHFAGSVHGRKQSRHRGMDTRDVTPKLYLQGSHV